MGLTYHPDAEIELIQAAQYYESRVATLGVQFLDEADRGVAVIVDAPELANDRGRRRRYLMPRFPYATYYRDFPDRLHTLAFKHSRHPDYWRYRISE